MQSLGDAVDLLAVVGYLVQAVHWHRLDRVCPLVEHTATEQMPRRLVHEVIMRNRLRLERHLELGRGDLGDALITDQAAVAALGCHVLGG